MKRLYTLFTYPEIWILTFLALVTRLWQLASPSALVFDEVYFRQFAASYLSHNFFFDIHPPLVKLIFAGIGALFHLSPEQVVSGDPGALILRILPAVAGAALVPLMYIIVRQIGLSRQIAVLSAVLVLCDNALLVESRFVLMDSLLLLAGFSALSCYLKLRKTKGNHRWVWLVVLALLLGALVSTKWTGLAVATLITVAWLIDGVITHTRWQRLVGEVVVAFCIAATIYVSCFAVHFALLTHSGSGDAFMSEKFQSTLIGNASYNPISRMSFWDKFIETNKEMYTAQSSLDDVTHPYASRWYSWPLEVRPVYYWKGSTLSNGMQGNIYLLGNPAVWWLSAAGALLALLVWLVRPRHLGRSRKYVALLLAGYALNFIPFIFIERPMFLYHYLFALIFSMLLTCIMLDRLFKWQTRKYGRAVTSRTYWLLLIIIVLGFLYFVPLSYGWPMTPADLQQKMWLTTWR